MKKSLISIILTISVLAVLAVAGPAQAFSVSLSNPNNVYQGKDVKFDIDMKIESDDSFLPIKETTLLINGPDGFNETCSLDINGSVTDCDLDIEIKKVKQKSNFGYGYGYDYGYGYNFGYGYGYDDGKIKFKVIWHTNKSIEEGNYTAKVVVLIESGLISKEYMSEEVSFLIKERKNKGDDHDDDDEDKKVLVCHVSPGNHDNAHTIKVSKNAVQAHLNHGDYLGKCDEERDDDDKDKCEERDHEDYDEDERDDRDDDDREHDDSEEDKRDHDNDDDNDKKGKGRK